MDIDSAGDMVLMVGCQATVNELRKVGGLAGGSVFFHVAALAALTAAGHSAAAAALRRLS